MDERTVFEIRRLITRTDLPVTRIGSAFGFLDASAFSKFVQRHMGDSPSGVRALDIERRRRARG